MDLLLRDVYYNTASPACYAGLNKVYAEAKKRDAGVTLKDVSEFLHRERTYTLHHPARKRFPRAKTIPSGLNSDWQADLAIFDMFAKENDGMKYLLVCVDVLSRKMYAEPVKSKRFADMSVAFDRIFARAGAKPWKLFSDAGIELNSKEMQKYFRDNDILKFTAYTNPLVHAAVVERANRTIKDRLYRYISDTKTLD